MSLFSFRGKRRETKNLPSSRRTFVPRLEALESRDLLSTFTVTSTSSDPTVSGSLPYEVNQANGAPGPNTINFNIGSGPQTISLTSTLYLDSQVTIDGTSQPGYNGTPLISLQGNANVPSIFYLGTGSSGSTIQGLDMNDFAGGNAVTITNSSSGDTIQNNWLGFYRDPSNGNVTLNNSFGGQFSNASGVGIASSNNTVRGNVIDGTYNAIRMGEDPGGAWSGTVYSGNHITGNFVGTDPTGTTSAGYGNTSSGIFLGQGCQANYIGPGNVFSGNAVHGVEMFGASDRGNIIFGNKIGTDVTGRYAIPNGDGITLTDSANANTIGGSFGGNIISGNKDLAVSLGLAGYGPAYNNYVQNNIIGLNASQTAIVGNGPYGISINSGGSGNQVIGNVVCGASLSGIILASTTSNVVNNNWIGENTAGYGFANAQYGVLLMPGANYNYVLGNAFGSNGLGSIYVDPKAIGNDIQGGGGGGAASVGAKIQLLFQDYGLLLQDLASGNFAGFSQQLNNIISLYFAIISEIFASV